MEFCVIILLIAFAIDIIIGDPIYPLHPIRIIGHLISIIEKTLFKIKLNGIFGGLLLPIIIITISLAIYFGIDFILPKHYNIIWAIFCLYSAIAFTDLFKHAKKVYNNLNDLEEAQNQVQMIIGRDAKLLDKSGVIRASIESVAESFNDGFFAIIFYFLLGSIIAKTTNYPLEDFTLGVAFVIIFKNINTLDSMVGYKSEKYEKFGKISARLDDALGFIPARLSIIFIILSPKVLFRNPVQTLKTALQNRLKHSSPNSAHTEATIAGTLNLSLGGPAIYPHGTVEKEWIGTGTKDPKEKDILKTNNIIFFAGIVTISITSVILYLL